MKTLIFDEKITGHHLEYLHHYYRGAVERPEDEFVFCLEEGFLKQKELYKWDDVENVSFHFLTSSELDYAMNVGGLKQRIRISRLIALKAKELRADRVLLTNFMYLIPFLLFVMPKGIKLRGIVYRIYLHTKNKVSKFRFAIDTICYWLIARSGVFETVFVLNDQKSAEILNDKFNTRKFTFLPDPVPEIDRVQLIDLRSQFEIPVDNKVYLHFGGLAQRKGTLEILKAINMSSDEVMKDKTFVFAGRVYNEIHDEFYQLIEEAKGKTHVLVFDTFCEYGFLYNMCYTCDAILMPYQQNEMSSGVLGYAAVFNKPVIGPSGGLIGDLIRKYHLGYGLPSVSMESIAHALTESVCCDSSDYAKRNDISMFINAILD